VHRKNGLFTTNNGIELPLLYATGAVGVSLIGPGRYSLDQALGDYRLLTPGVTWIILALGLIGGVVNLAMRRPTPASPPV
jgi:putative oxidoreductase